MRKTLSESSMQYLGSFADTRNMHYVDWYAPKWPLSPKVIIKIPPFFLLHSTFITTVYPLFPKEMKRIWKVVSMIYLIEKLWVRFLLSLSYNADSFVPLLNISDLKIDWGWNFIQHEHSCKTPLFKIYECFKLYSIIFLLRFLMKWCLVEKLLYKLIPSLQNG